MPLHTICRAEGEARQTTMKPTRRKLPPQALSIFQAADDDDGGKQTEDDGGCGDGREASACACKVIPPLSAEEYREQGCALAETGRFVEALRLWKQGLSFFHSDHLLHELCAQAYLELDLDWKAVYSAQACYDLQPNWVEGCITLARCRREVGELKGSVDMYSKAMALFERNATAGADVYEQNNAFEELKREWSEAQGLLSRLEEALRNDMSLVAEAAGAAARALVSGCSDANVTGTSITEVNVQKEARERYEAEHEVLLCQMHLRQRCRVVAKGSEP